MRKIFKQFSRVLLFIYKKLPTTGYPLSGVNVVLFVISASEQPLRILVGVDTATFRPTVAVGEITLGNGEFLQELRQLFRYGRNAVGVTPRCVAIRILVQLPYARGTMDVAVCAFVAVFV